MRSVLITGGLGRIGQKLAPRLHAAGYHTTVVGRPTSNPDVRNHLVEQGIDVQHAECLDDPQSCKDLFQRADAIIHLACSSNPALSEHDPWTDVSRNIKGTLRLFELAQQAHVEQFVFASSGGTVYGSTTTFPSPETAVPHPIGMHGAMKLACEQYLAVFSRRGGTRLKILRIANPYGMTRGIRQQGFIDVAIANLRAGHPITIWGDGSVRRDYLHIDDLCSAFLKTLQCNDQFTVNIGSGEHHSLNDIIDELGHHFDLTNKVSWERARPVDVPLSVLDNTLAKNQLDWSPVILLPHGIELAVHGV
jgi:UDP-glucose 4-epimerase